MSLAQNYATYLKADLSGYVGEWVAIFQDKIIAHGINPKEVLKEAMGVSKNKRVIIAKVPTGQVELY